MAAARYRGYRDYDPRDRDFDREAPRRKDYHLDDQYHRDRNPNTRDSIGHKSRDSNGRSSSNGFNHSKNYQKYPPRSRSPMVARKRVLDREPGEVSSGSDSEKYSRIKENGHLSVNKETKETGSSPSKKRKFSPIVWDQDKSKQPINAASQKTQTTFPPLSPTPEQSILHRDPCVNDDNEPGEIEEEIYPTARTISSSRWAENDEEIETVAPKKKKSVSPLERETKNKKSVSPVERETNPKKSLSPVERETTNKKSVSPLESGEVLVRESSVRTVSKSSITDEEEREDDYMDIERENYSSETDSESEFSREQTPEPEPQKPTHRIINMFQSCRSVDEFERLNKINEGTYGVVYRARDKKTGEIVALKKIKMEREREGFPLTSLREINILLSFHHGSIVDVKEVVVGSSLDSIFMVMEYMEHDLKGVMETMKQPYSQSEVKCLMLQLLEGIKYLHDNWVIHRDLKTSNLLLNNSGELKICDFGMARQYGSPLKPYTQLVVTLWYRAPELLLGGKLYSTAIDMWSIGCIMAELLTKEPLFSGKNEVDQLDLIFKTLGRPNEETWPGYKNLPGSKVKFSQQQPSNKLHSFKEKLRSYKSTKGKMSMLFHSDSTLSLKGFDLLDKLLTYDPEKRISVDEALEHPWFREVPLPKSKDFMPTFPSLNEKDRIARRRNVKSPDPIEELRKKLMQEDTGSRGIFG